MSGFVIHLFCYVAINGFLVCAWALTTGSFDQVERIARDPALATDLDFWPVWPILAWSVAIVIHLGVVLAGIPRFFMSERARNRRRKAARVAAETGVDVMQRGAAAFQALATKRASGPPPPSRRWVTVMFADIANSTALTESLGDEEWTRVLARYRSLVRAALLARGGEEVGTQGDGFLGRFATPADAVLCGVDIQRELEEVHDQSDFDLKVRIGVHAGEAVEDDGDLVGRVINLASRVTSEAEPGEILVTEPVADYLGGQLLVEDRGLRPLRGVAQPRHLLAVLWDRDGEATAPGAPSR